MPRLKEAVRVCPQCAIYSVATMIPHAACDGVNHLYGQLQDLFRGIIGARRVYGIPIHKSNIYIYMV